MFFSIHFNNIKFINSDCYKTISLKIKSSWQKRNFIMTITLLKLVELFFLDYHIYCSKTKPWLIDLIIIIMTNGRITFKINYMGNNFKEFFSTLILLPGIRPTSDFKLLETISWKHITFHTLRYFRITKYYLLNSS